MFLGVGSKGYYFGYFFDDFIGEGRDRLKINDFFGGFREVLIVGCICFSCFYFLFSVFG